jgi:hypothetical protein
MHRAKRFSQFLTESLGNPRITSSEAADFDPQLSERVDIWVNRTISEGIAEEEIEEVQYLMQELRVDMDWVIYRDGTVDIILSTPTRESLRPLLIKLPEGIITRLDPESNTGAFRLPGELQFPTTAFLPKGSNDVDDMLDQLFDDF